MRIGLAGQPARWMRHAALPAGLTLALLATVAACRPDLTPPGAPTRWPTTAARHWQWQWQLAGVLDPTVEADVFVLDAVDTTAAQTAELRSRGRRLVCHVPVGSFHPSDPDASRYPAQVRGTTVAATGRVWLDVRRWDTVRPVLADRFRLCRGKGFGAVVLADADGYDRRSGFLLEFDDQLQFNRRVAALARSLDLSPGLLGSLPQVAALAPDFDFAVNEECVRLRQCDKLLPFADAGKPVFHVEYTGTTSDFCVTSVGYGFASIRKNRTLDAWRRPCPPPP
ncbi:endo alpha-1,4 polygalactosaminidase [Micromonospora sp. WMMD1082]|uniref:endo alpha-1,4 polygalactosaminidase n=1 Tax=Micromonospora sp. WMMD1082 TaxID=3016104 RepID=UPI0024162B18|nr:endo alpha-1,4 polygalactosaminidase [Micromonospora sp. WMMD1082]MDG4792559.1 endo alpha-1,4 polygalactosaminidase [Micromonospora sp. WMMD1082]